MDFTPKRAGELLERDRVYRILIEQLAGDFQARKLWSEMPKVTEEVRKEQVYGFTCQISALTQLGSKLFGHKHEDLEAAALKALGS